MSRILSFLSDYTIPLLVGLPVVVTLLMAIAGVGLPKNQNTRVTILEVFAHPTQPPESYWLELYNDSDQAVEISGWSLRVLSAQGEQNATITGRTIIPAEGFLLIPANPAGFAQNEPILARSVATPSQPLSWTASTSFTLQLLHEDGRVADQLVWPLSGPNAPRIGPTGPASIVRRTIGVDTNAYTAADWRVGPASPGGIALPTMPPATRYVLVEVTNYVSLIAGFLLWSAFVLIGLIARRFERLTGQRTYWQAMVLAPIGIVIYNLIQTRGFFQKGSMSDCRTPSPGPDLPPGWTFGFGGCEQLWSFIPLFIAAVALFWVLRQFYNAARRILEV